MSIYEKKQVIPGTFEDGIWLDYQEGTWLFFLKDQVWQKEEVQRIESANVMIQFAQKGIVDLFLLDIFDCLETSDMPFCVKDIEEAVFQQMLKCPQFCYEIVVLDGHNTVVTIREGQFTKKESQKLVDALAARSQETYTSDDFEKAYAKLSARFEPYEFEENALFKHEG